MDVHHAGNFPQQLHEQQFPLAFSRRAARRPPGQRGAKEYSSFGRPYLVPLVTEFYSNSGNEKNYF